MCQLSTSQVYHFVPSSRILVCTPSNSAADLICIRLHDSGYLHAGALARVNASCRQEEVLSSRIETHCSFIATSTQGGLGVTKVIICKFPVCTDVMATR